MIENLDKDSHKTGCLLNEKSLDDDSVMAEDLTVQRSVAEETKIKRAPMQIPDILLETERALSIGGSSISNILVEKESTWE